MALATVAVACGFASPSPAWGARAPAASRPPVVLIAVPRMDWANAPAALDAWSKANVSMRSGRARPTTPDGYLTLGKGARTALPTEDRVTVEGIGAGTFRVVGWPAIVAHDRGLHFPGRLGALGAALRASGQRWVLVTDDLDAVVMVADSRGVSGDVVRGGAGGVRAAVDGGAHAVIAATTIDAVPDAIAAAPGACRLVVSASTPGDDRHLGALAASPECGVGAGAIWSPATHHLGLVTLPEVTSTYLSELGLRASLAPARARGHHVASRASLVARDRRVGDADNARIRIVWAFVVLNALAAVAAVARLPGRMALMYGTLAVPAANFLATPAHWWTGGPGRGLVTVAVIAVAVAAVAAVVARGDPRGTVAALGLMTIAVVAGDALAGGRLELDAPFGNSVVVGARYFGIGNIGLAVLTAATLVTAGIAVDRWGADGLRWAAVALAAVAIAEGAPVFGAKVGTVFEAIPAFGVFLLWASGRRPTWRWAVIVVAAVAISLGALGAADLARAAGSRTHLAKDLAGGHYADVVRRKARSAVSSIHSPMAALVPIAAAALAARRPRLGASNGLGATAAGLLVAAVAGTVLNDSGLVVGGMVAAFGWPSLLALADTGATAPAPAR